MSSSGDLDENPQLSGVPLELSWSLSRMAHLLILVLHSLSRSVVSASVSLYRLYMSMPVVSLWNSPAAFWYFSSELLYLNP